MLVDLSDAPSKQPIAMADNPRVFISYSHDSDAHSELVLQFAWALRSHGIDVELDQFHNEEIVDWPRWCRQQIKRQNSDFVVCVCTAEYQRRVDGGVPPERGKGVYWEGALLDDEVYDDKGNRRLIPVLFNDEPDTVIVDFLRGWTRCRVSDFNLNDSGYEHLLRILTRQVHVEENSLGNIPVLETRRAPGNSSVSPSPETPPKVDISRIIKYAPERLIGREAETALLDESWQRVIAHEEGRPHVLGFVALGGEGKTSLVAKWLAKLAGKDWPGCDSAFAWSFYSQGSRDQAAVSSDLFLVEALKFFGDPETAGSALGAYEKGQRLAELVGGQRSLLILDGVEPLQYPISSPTGSLLKDQGLETLLKGLAASSNGLCLVTTRFPIHDLAGFSGSTYREEELERLSREAGVALLKDCGVQGSETRADPTSENPDPLNEYEQLVEDVMGHALTLQILGQYLKRAHHGDIRRRDRVELAKADSKVHASAGFTAGHAFRAIAAYETWLADDSEESRRELAVLRLLGLFDRPATADCVQALREPPVIEGLTDPLIDLTDEDWDFTLSALSDARLVSVNREQASGELVSLDAHPLIRKYFADRLKAGEESHEGDNDDSSSRLPPPAFRLVIVVSMNTSARPTKVTNPRLRTCNLYTKQ